MGRFAGGILVATLACYLWGFVYWGLMDLPYKSWKTPRDNAVARETLRTQFPENGTYLVPSFELGLKERQDQFLEGPVAFVHMTDIDGRSMQDPRILGGGFGLMLVTVIVLAVLLKVSGMRWYVGRVLLISLCGLAAALSVDIGAHVWWRIDLAWKLWQALYTLTSFTITGVVLAWFVRPKPA